MNASTCKTAQALVPGTGLLLGSVAWARACPRTPGVAENETAGAEARIDVEFCAYLHDAQVHSPNGFGQDYRNGPRQAGRN